MAFSPLQPMLAASCVPRTGSSVGKDATGFLRNWETGLRA